MSKKQLQTDFRLHKGWKKTVRSAVLHVFSLAKLSAARTFASTKSPRDHAQATIQRLEEVILQLREEIRIKDARMAHLPPLKRPHYPPVERMAILELRALRGWTLAQTADAFLVTPLTISSWLQRLDEQGPQALVQLREPVNKYPDYVRYLVQRLKTLCPTLGKVKIAQMLARAGLHLGSTTVSRMLKSPPALPPQGAAQHSQRAIQAKQRNHVWHVDLTTIPIGGGLWTTWLPTALPQRWWFGLVLDQFSRRIMGV